MTTIDPLTGIYDRTAFMALLASQLRKANTYGTKVALLLVDINRFHRINSLFGYEVGDEILKKLVLLLRNVARDRDYVARVGDNTFALLLDSIMNTGHAELAAHKILNLLQSPFVLESRQIYLECTVAISLCPVHASNPSFLMRECESILHEAKDNNQKIGVSQVPDGDELPENWDIELALDDALGGDQLLVYYQPKTSIDSGRVVGAEALLRWRHPAKGFIPPEYFIPIAERLGHIKPITQWLLNTVLRQTSEWTDRWGVLAVSVNISPDFILMPDFKDIITNAMNIWSNDTVQLCLEITERSLVPDPERSFAVLRDLQDLGITISIDDFGTGYSSLSYFDRLPVNELKIDRSFVVNMVKSEASRNIVRLIIDLAHAFNMEVVAEGIEDEATMEHLKKLRCDIAQGYLVGRPMANDIISKWLESL